MALANRRKSTYRRMNSHALAKDGTLKHPGCRTAAVYRVFRPEGSMKMWYWWDSCTVAGHYQRSLHAAVILASNPAPR
jgi:hypothetical protein